MLNTPIKPMLLEKRYDPFNHKDYIFEWKVDGVRGLFRLDNNKVSLYSRHGTDCTINFPELQSAANYIKTKSIVLDGEFIVFNNNKPAFDLTMKRFMSTPTSKRLKDYSVKFIIFDVLYLDGTEVMSKPLLDRKNLINKVIETNDLIFPIDFIEESGEGFFEQIKSLDLEGIVAKRKDSKYQLDKRSHDWLKVKNYRETDCVVLGYSLDKIGLYLGENKDGNISFCGFSELGLDPVSFHALCKASEDIITKKEKNTTWLEPVLNCRIQHIGRDSKDRFREATFKKFIV